MIDEYAKIKLYYLNLLINSINYRRSSFYISSPVEELKHEKQMLKVLNELYKMTFITHGVDIDD